MTEPSLPKEQRVRRLSAMEHLRSTGCTVTWDIDCSLVGVGADKLPYRIQPYCDEHGTYYSRTALDAVARVRHPNSLDYGWHQ